MKLKKYTFLLGLVVLFSCSDKNETNTENSQHEVQSILQNDSDATIPTHDTLPIRVSKLEKSIILKALFSVEDLDTSAMAVWSPSEIPGIQLEIFNQSKTYEGKIWTSLDTLIQFTDVKGNKCAAAVFSSYRYHAWEMDDTIKYDISECHFCGAPIGMALFKQVENESWEMYAFNPEVYHNGIFGEYKNLSPKDDFFTLKSLGNNWNAIEIMNPPTMHMEHFCGGQALISIESHYPDLSPAKPLNLIASQYTELNGENEHDYLIPTFNYIPARPFAHVISPYLDDNYQLRYDTLSFSQKLGKFTSSK